MTIKLDKYTQGNGSSKQCQEKFDSGRTNYVCRSTLCTYFASRLKRISIETVKRYYSLSSVNFLSICKPKLFLNLHSFTHRGRYHCAILYNDWHYCYFGKSSNLQHQTIYDNSTFVFLYKSNRTTNMLVLLSKCSHLMLLLETGLV